MSNVTQDKNVQNKLKKKKATSNDILEKEEEEEEKIFQFWMNLLIFSLL